MEPSGLWERLRRRAEAHTRPARTKITSAPSAFPFLGRLRRQAINPKNPKGVKAWGIAPWGRRKSPMSMHTRQNRPEVRRPTECNPRTGEERPHTNALERPRGPLNFRRLKPFSYGRKGTPLLSHHVNRKFFYKKKWTQKISTSIVRYRLPKSINSIFIELFLAEVFCKCW